MRRMIPVVVALIAAITLVLTACGGGGGNATSSGGSETGAVTEGGILRIGTTNYIDSFNPWNFIESQAFNAFIMVYPQLVQYDYQDGQYVIVGDLAESWDTSSDGKTWTFHLHSGTKWSDGQPLTAADVAWTINTTVQYAGGPTAVMAPALNHVKNAEAPDPTTLVLNYKSPVGNALAQLEQGVVTAEKVQLILDGRTVWTRGKHLDAFKNVGAPCVAADLALLCERFQRIPDRQGFIDRIAPDVELV